MRWTSPDPAASPYYNLFGYCGNTLGASYDPDGLEPRSLAERIWAEREGGGNLPVGNPPAYEASSLLGGGGIGGMLDAVGSAPMGATYGAANTLSLGGYSQLISREDFAGHWGVNSNSFGIRAGEVLGAAGGATALTMLTGGVVSAGLGAGLGCSYAGAMAVAGEGLAWGLGGMVGGNAMSLGLYDRPLTPEENAHAFVTGFLGGAAGRVVGGAGAEARNMFGAPGSSVCFVAGTQVAVKGDSATLASKNIEDIRLGDWVWSRDEQTGEESFKPVVRLFRNETRELAHLTYTSGPERGALTGTPGHKFWNESRQQWTPMGDLKPGQMLKLADGASATVTTCVVEHLATPVTIYNFEVADWHTYHVGSTNTGWVWVHNKNCGPGQYSTDTGHMSDAARAFQGNRNYSVPWDVKPSARSRDVVKFDGWDGKKGELIDRKLNVTTFPKSKDQA